MPYLTHVQIEQIAKRIINAYRKLPSMEGQAFTKVVPEILISELLKIDVQFHILSRNGKILGLTSCGETEVLIYDQPEAPQFTYLDGNTIFVDSSLTEKGSNVGRLNFTLVHEACHQIYKMLYPKEYLNETCCRKIYCCTTSRRSDVDWEEWRTNALTSAILMPQELIKDGMSKFGFGDKLRLLNRVFAPRDYEKFCEFADSLGVSKTALSIRMKQLGLIGADYLFTPYELLDIYPDDDQY